MASAEQHNGEPPYRIELLASSSHELMLARQWQFFCQGVWQSDPSLFVTEPWLKCLSVRRVVRRSRRRRGDESQRSGQAAQAQRCMAEQQLEALKRTNRAPEKAATQARKCSLDSETEVEVTE